MTIYYFVDCPVINWLLVFRDALLDIGGGGVPEFCCLHFFLPLSLQENIFSGAELFLNVSLNNGYHILA